MGDTSYWKLLSSGDLRIQERMPKGRIAERLGFVKETRTRSMTDSDKSVHTLTLYQGGEAVGVLKYEAFHGYGRGPGLRNLIKRMILHEDPYTFSGTDRSQCVSEHNIVHMYDL